MTEVVLQKLKGTFRPLEEAVQDPQLWDTFLQLPLGALEALAAMDDLQVVSENTVALVVACWLEDGGREPPGCCSRAAVPPAAAPPDPQLLQGGAAAAARPGPGAHREALRRRVRVRGCTCIMPQVSVQGLQACPPVPCQHGAELPVACAGV